MKKYISYLMPILLFVGVLIIGFLKIKYRYDLWYYSCINADILVIGLYLLWIIFEISVSRVDVTQEKVVSDYGTRELYGLSHSLTVFSALWFDPIWNNPGIYHLIGFALFLFGISFRIWAIRTLGRYYSHMVRKIDGHAIIATGPYALLRHPAYAGMITAHAGITLFYFNYGTLAVFLILLIPSIIIRIIIEEKALMKIEGYAEFSQNRKRIIPFIW